MAEQILVGGEASGPVLVLDEPLSLWGGFDPATGDIVDPRHPQFGQCLSGVVLAMAHGRGSSSGSSGLVEAVRVGTAPVAFVMTEPDEIIVVGAVVANELYGTTVPIIVVDDATFDRLRSGVSLSIAADGRLELGPSAPPNLDEEQ